MVVSFAEEAVYWERVATDEHEKRERMQTAIRDLLASLRDCEFCLISPSWLAEYLTAALGETPAQKEDES